MDKPASTRSDYLIYGLVSVLTLALFWQVQDFDFTHYDDNLYVTDNAEVRAGLGWQSIAWAFTHHRANNWHPLTWVSHMADCQLGELDPAWHHFTSVVLHTTNAVLLFVLLMRLTGRRWRSAFVAVLFAVHPLHVESVAWVAERKDVLSTFFWMLTTIGYVAYVRAPSLRRYLLTALLLVLGLLSKPMLVTLPITLLLLDVWPLDRIAGRTRAAVVEKAPLMLLALGSAVVTFVVQRVSGAVGTLDAFPLGERVANALVSYTCYLRMLIWPYRLACFYPHARSGLPMWEVLISAAGLALVTCLVIRARGSKPYLLTGWLWYLVTLVPVIGLVQVGNQAMADRYTYVPLIGIFVMITWGVPDLLGRLAPGTRSVMLSVGAVAWIAVLLPVTYRQIGYWRNDITLWTHALSVTRGNAVAHYNLGTTYANQGDMENAELHFAEAVRIDPAKYDAHNNLGAMLLQRGETEKAIAHFRQAVKLKPDYADAHSNLGTAFLHRGRYREAAYHFRACLKITPDDETALGGLREAEAGLGLER